MINYNRWSYGNYQLVSPIPSDNVIRWSNGGILLLYEAVPIASTGNPWYYYAQMITILALGLKSIELAIIFLEYTKDIAYA